MIREAEARTCVPKLELGTCRTRGTASLTALPDWSTPEKPLWFARTSTFDWPVHQLDRRCSISSASCHLTANAVIASDSTGETTILKPIRSSSSADTIGSRLLRRAYWPTEVWELHKQSESVLLRCAALRQRPCRHRSSAYRFARSTLASIESFDGSGIRCSSDDDEIGIMT